MVAGKLEFTPLIQRTELQSKGIADTLVVENALYSSINTGDSAETHAPMNVASSSETHSQAPASSLDSALSRAMVLLSHN